MDCCRGKKQLLICISFLFVEYLWVGDAGERQGIAGLNLVPLVDGHQCKICGKKFLNHGSLYKHNDVHRGKTRCPICQVVFSRTLNMKTHMKTKHGWSFM
jgi:hypothetical protein